MRAYESGDPSVTGALRALKEIAERMTEALRGADLVRVGALLDDNWARQQALDPAMRTAEMARLERAVQEAGGMGGKAAGAGAGGSMFFVVRNAAAAGAAARAAGATVLPLAWAGEGARAW
jgi:galactokinase/mevalonate kinase-like predicted kinase